MRLWAHRRLYASLCSCAAPLCVMHVALAATVTPTPPPSTGLSGSLWLVLLVMTLLVIIAVRMRHHDSMAHRHRRVRARHQRLTHAHHVAEDGAFPWIRLAAWGAQAEERLRGLKLRRDESQREPAGPTMNLLGKRTAPLGLGRHRLVLDSRLKLRRPRGVPRRRH